MAADGLVNVVSSMLTKAKDNRTGTWSASLGGVALLPNTDYCLALSRDIITDRGGPETSALNPGLSFDGEPAFVMFATVSVMAANDSASVVGLKDIALPTRPDVKPGAATDRSWSGAGFFALHCDN